MTFPPGNIVVPIFINDTQGHTVSANFTIKVLAAGSPLFQGFSSTPVAGFSTDGGDAVVIQGSNFIGDAAVHAVYGPYTTSVLDT